MDGQLHALMRLRLSRLIYHMKSALTNLQEITDKSFAMRIRLVTRSFFTAGSTRPKWKCFPETVVAYERLEYSEDFFGIGDSEDQALVDFLQTCGNYWCWDCNEPFSSPRTAWSENIQPCRCGSWNTESLKDLLHKDLIRPASAESLLRFSGYAWKLSKLLLSWLKNKEVRRGRFRRLCQEVDVSPATVRDWINVESTPTKLNVITRICSLLEVSLDTLLLEGDLKNSPSNDNAINERALAEKLQAMNLESKGVTEKIEKWRQDVRLIDLKELDEILTTNFGRETDLNYFLSVGPQTWKNHLNGRHEKRKVRQSKANAISRPKTRPMLTQGEAQLLSDNLQVLFRDTDWSIEDLCSSCGIALQTLRSLGSENAKVSKKQLGVIEKAIGRKILNGRWQRVTTVGVVLQHPIYPYLLRMD